MLQQPPAYFGNQHNIINSSNDKSKEAFRCVEYYVKNSALKAPFPAMKNEISEENCDSSDQNTCKNRINWINSDYRSTENQSASVNSGENSENDQSDNETNCINVNQVNSGTLTTPFSVKDILNMVDQNTTNFNKISGFNGANYDAEDVDALKNFDTLVDQTNQKNYCDATSSEFLLPNQQYDPVSNCQYEVYNNYHHSGFSAFYNGLADHGSVYFGNGNYYHHHPYDGNAYHSNPTAAAPDYCTQFSPNSNLAQCHYGQSYCYNNGYNTNPPAYYQNDLPVQNIGLPQKGSNISPAKSMCESAFVQENVEKSTPPSCALTSNYPGEIEVSSIMCESENVAPGITSQHVRQLNSLCVPFDVKKSNNNSKSKAVENADSMQSKIFHFIF